MAEIMTLNVDIEKEILEQAKASFKRRGLDIQTEVHDFIARSAFDDNIVYLENGDWYDASQMTREEYDMVIESIEYSEANPDSSMSLDEFRKWSKEMLDEKIRSKLRAKSAG